MEQANIPSQAELSSLYGSWNPMGYMQGMENQDLAAQFRQQGLQANRADIGSKLQANAQNEQMNPLLVAQQGLVNTGKSLNNDNQVLVNKNLGLDVNKKETLQPDTVAAEREALRTKLGDEQYNQISTAVLRAHMKNIESGDPDAIAKTGSLLDMLGGPTASKVADRSQARNFFEGKVAQETNQNQLNRESAERIAGLNAQTKLDIADRHAANVLAKAQASQSAEQYYVSLQKSKAPADQVAKARKDWLDSKAAYQNALDLKALAEGKGVQRQGDRTGTGTADDPIILDN